jgi:hypothetical protein
MAAAGRATAARYDWPLVVTRVEDFYKEARRHFQADGGAGRRFSLRLLRGLPPLGAPGSGPRPLVGPRLGDLRGRRPGGPEGDA